MKYQLLNNEPLQFFNEAGDLIGTILISGSGDMVIRPESGSSKDIILGNQDTVGDVEIGLPSAEANLKLMGGGLITANGGTLTIGDSTVGDQLIFGAPITASLVQSASFAVTASHVIGGGGGGTTVVANPGSSGGGALSTIGIAGTNFSIAGGSAASGTVSSSAQITALGFTNNSATSSLVTNSATASLITNSQTSSMSVFSSSFASTASLLLGTVVSASFAQTASFLLGGITTPTGTVSGSAQITALGFTNNSATSSLVTNSETSSFVVNSQTSSFVTNTETGSFLTNASTSSFNNLAISDFEGNEIPGNGSTSSIAVTVVDDGANRFVLDGVKTGSLSLTAGNAYRFDQSDNTNNNHPIAFKISGSSDNYTTRVSASGTPGNAAASTLISVTNATPNLTYYCTVHGTGMGGDGKGVLTIITGSLIQNGFLEVSGSTRLSGSLDVLTNITASGNISSSGYVSASNFIGDGSALTNLPASSTFPFTGSAIISGSLIVTSSNNGTPFTIDGSGSTIFNVIGSEGTIFSLEDDLDGTLFTVNDRSGIPQFEVSASGLVEVGEGPLLASTSETGSINTGSVSPFYAKPSSPLQMQIPSGSSPQLFGVPGYYRVSFDDGHSDFTFWQDDNIKLSYDISGVDIEGQIMRDPTSGEIHITLDNDGTLSALDKQVSDNGFDLNSTISNDDKCIYTFAAPFDPAWPFYRVTIVKTSATHNGYFYAIIEKFV